MWKRKKINLKVECGGVERGGETELRGLEREITNIRRLAKLVKEMKRGLNP